MVAASLGRKVAAEVHTEVAVVLVMRAAQLQAAVVAVLLAVGAVPITAVVLVLAVGAVVAEALTVISQIHGTAVV